jgi:hypothetical protein
VFPFSSRSFPDVFVTSKTADISGRDELDKRINGKFRNNMINKSRRREGIYARTTSR